MTLGGEPRPEAGSGYSAGMLARHVTLCLTRMRAVVREMVEAGAGWGAFWAATAASSFAIGLESALRQHFWPDITLGPEGGPGSVGSVVLFGLAIFGLFALMALMFAFVFWATARLFGAKITLRQSAIGVAAGGLPQIAFSAAIIACALVFRQTLGPDQQTGALTFIDYAVVVPLLGYGLVAYAAATGFSLGMALVVQLIGVVGGTLILFGTLSVGGLAFDQSLGWLLQLVLE